MLDDDRIEREIEDIDVIMATIRDYDVVWLAATGGDELLRHLRLLDALQKAAPPASKGLNPRKR